jgi:CheY-like chemotaxis protein
MTRATQDKIFEPFFTTKELGKGTGLGLATVYGIVKQSEGYIWVYSELGVGTTFKIYLPRVAPKKPQRSIEVRGSHTITAKAVSPFKPKKPTPKASTTIPTVLVVEDDTLISELIQRVLKEAGYNIVQATNGREAMNLLLEYTGPLDLVLTDIVMPEMSGRELVRHLKVRWSHLKVMCMSGYTDQTVQRHGILEQCDHFLQKPFTPSMLLERISSLVTAAGSGYNK